MLCCKQLYDYNEKKRNLSCVRIDLNLKDKHGKKENYRLAFYNPICDTITTDNDIFEAIY